MSIIPQCMNLGKIMVKTRTLDDGGDDVTQYLEETDDQMPQTTSSSPCLFAPIDWKKFFLITGKAGTGKSQIVLQAIEWALDNDLKVLVAKPTALLDIRYANGFDKTITSETIHPFVSCSRRHTTNNKLVPIQL